MLSWRRYVTAREACLAREGEPLKTVGEPEVGLDLLQPGGAADDFPGLLRHVQSAIEAADRYFVAEPPTAVENIGGRLSFQSPLAGLPAGPNDTARALLFRSRGFERAVVLLPHWNSVSAEYHSFARTLARFGINCLQLTLPYHDERQTPGAGFARELVSENLGLTIRANRQAIAEARAWLAWLRNEGYRHLGIVGVSIGSSIASIAAALDHLVDAVVLLLPADDFADAVWTGSATRHVKQSLARRFSPEDLRSAWALISPGTYAARLAGRVDKLLIISGTHDTVFLPELTERFVGRLKSCGADPDWARLRCGHYTLSLPPYSVIAFVRTLSHLRSNLR